MKTLKEEAKQARILILLAAAGLALHGTALYAEETTDPVSTLTQAATQVLTETQPSVTTDAQQAAQASRKEAFKQWLENHPNLKARLDKNGDGNVDRSEAKNGFRK